MADQIVELAGDNPALLQLLAQAARSASPSPVDLFTHLLDHVLKSSVEPQQFAALIDELALFGGRCDLLTMSTRLGTSPDAVRDLVLTSELGIVVHDSEDDTVQLFHPIFRDFVLRERIRFSPIQLADLKFGSEESAQPTLASSHCSASRSSTPDAGTTPNDPGHDSCCRSAR